MEKPVEKPEENPVTEPIIKLPKNRGTPPPITLIDRLKEDPLVPIGMAITASILGVGVYTLKTRNSRLSQRMMRWRIMAQTTTIVFVCWALYKESKRGQVIKT